MDWKVRLNRLSRYELVTVIDDAIRPEYLYADERNTFGTVIADRMHQERFDGFKSPIDLRFHRHNEQVVAPFGIVAPFVFNEKGEEVVHHLILSCIESERVFNVLQSHHIAGADACSALGVYRRTKELTDLFYGKLSRGLWDCQDIASVVEAKISDFRSHPIEKINAELNDALVALVKPELRASEIALVIRLVRPTIRFLPEGKDRWESTLNVGWANSVEELIGKHLHFDSSNAIYWTVANAIDDIQSKSDEHQDRSVWIYENAIFESLDLAGYSTDEIDYVLQKMRPVTVFLASRLI